MSKILKYETILLTYMILADIFDISGIFDAYPNDDDLTFIRKGKFMNFYYPTLTNQIEQLPLFLTSVGIYFEETQISREDGFNDHQWIQTVSGEGEIFFDGTSHIIRPNEGMFIPAHVAHHYARITDQWITHWYSFNGRNTVNFLASIGFDSIRFIGLTDAGNHLQRIEDIYYMAISNFNANAFRISSLMYEQLEQVHSLFAAIDFDDQRG